jgi:hypothetical protein
MSRFMVKSILRLIPILALTLAAGCFPYRRTIFYRSGGESSRSADVPAPESYVFDLCRQRIAPVPDAAKGWCFRLSVRPELVREGAVIRVPGEGARPLLETIAAPSILESREAAGTVRIRRVERDRVLADVDLEDRRAPGGWSLRRSVWFRPGEPPPRAR